MPRLHECGCLTGRMIDKEAGPMLKELLEELENLQVRLHEMRVSL